MDPHTPEQNNSPITPGAPQTPHILGDVGPLIGVPDSPSQPPKKSKLQPTTTLASVIRQAQALKTQVDAIQSSLDNLIDQLESLEPSKTV